MDLLHREKTGTQLLIKAAISKMELAREGLVRLSGLSLVSRVTFVAHFFVTKKRAGGFWTRSLYGTGTLQSQASPLFSRTFTSTRRFSARPDTVSFEATGAASPMAPGATI